MAKVRIKTEAITDWQSFHESFKREMGFPDFYGMNMNAWIDCLTYLDEEDGMSRFHLREREHNHSDRSTIIGSTLVARRAGA
jgi:barstar (barnase inhibitor)